jgi:carbon monoxide dehydrogenase subunit G
VIIEVETTVAAPADDVYALMLDVERVVPCMPGATLTGGADDRYEVDVAVKVGPVAVSYGGSVAIVESDPAQRRAVMRGEGKEKRGQGRASATMTLSVTEDGPGAARLVVESDVAVSGRVAQMGQAVMRDVATELFGEMAACVERKLAPQADQTGAERTTVERPRNLSVLRLVLAVLRGRWRRLSARGR